MNRRQFMLLLGSAGTAARALRAQQKAMPVIGFLGSGSPDPNAPLVAAFRQGLSETGWFEGQNLAIEHSWAEGRYDQLPALAADLLDRKAVPIVFVSGGDPAELGLVASLARPGGNLTGVSILAAELTPKRLELLSELVPQAGVIALLVNPNNPQTEGVIQDMQEAARAKRLRLHVLKASTEGEIDDAFASFVQQHAGGLVVEADPFFTARSEQLVALASRDAVPAIYTRREFAVSGGLISYGTSLAGAFRQAGIYAGKILAGAKPADLPVQQPTTFELVINLKTAKALGLIVPPSILGRADEVIE